MVLVYIIRNKSFDKYFTPGKNGLACPVLVLWGITLIYRAVDGSKNYEAGRKKKDDNGRR